MNTDCYFTTGKIHSVCQDYALAINDIHPFAILSDGCGSSKFTDIGSRILTHALAKGFHESNLDSFIKNFNWHTFYDYFDGHLKKTLSVADFIRASLYLPSECLDATLLAIYPLFNEALVLFVGDGVFAYLTKDKKKIIVYDIEYKTNAPEYLSYDLDLFRKKAFLKEFSSVKTLTKYYIALDSGESKISKESENDLQDKFLYWRLPFDEFSSLVLFSDGLKSFRKEAFDAQQQISFLELIPEFLNFKSMAGTFIRRRAKRCLENLSSRKIIHLDDFSIAGLHVE